MEWANRLGLLLNFIAAVLMAPEIFGAIFGVGKIESFASGLKGKASRFLNNYQGIIQKIFTRLKIILTDLYNSVMTLALYVGLLFFLCMMIIGKDIFGDFNFMSIFDGLHGISALIVYSLLVFSIIAMIYYGYQESEAYSWVSGKKDYSGIWSALALIPIMLPIVMLFIAFFIAITIIVTLSSLIYIVTLWSLMSMSSWVVHMLNGNLSKILIRIGLAFLIIGFVLQFAATF